MILRGVLLVALFVLLLPGRAAGQDDALVKAREAATSGRRAEALAMLEAHLARTPRDVDARLLYGLVLSWEGRYDDARRALQEVLTQAPTYTDARVALMNVEYWSGRTVEARTLADQIVAANPGNATARAVRDRLEAASRPWWGSVSYTLDTFNDETDPWHEIQVYVTRHTPVGALIFRGWHATRFGLNDQLIETEFYPRFRPGTYAYIAAGIAPDPALYPQYRLAFELYQSVGRGFEVSGGMRYMDFEEATQIYVGTLSKYVGNWMLTGKVSHVPAQGDLDSTSYYAGFRRYFGSDGSSYTGVTYGHGLTRDEIRSAADLATVNANLVRGEFDWLVRTRLRLFGAAGTSRQERVNRAARWQTTFHAGLSVQF